ncbi:MAG: DUF342 domain-containing protein [bacterium]|nr:DUF342 domain-containing protein [bacterium]
MDKSQAVWVTVSYDGLKAYLTVNPNADNVKLAVDDLQKELKENGIIYGIKEEVLGKIVEAHKARELAPKILVAEGLEPFEGEKPKVKYMFNFSAKPGENTKGKTDYRETSNVIQVKQYQILAGKTPMKPTRDGLTVKGEDIQPSPVRDIQLEAGHNVVKRKKKETGDTIYFVSTVNGALQFRDNTLTVNPVLKITGNVNFNVGNIRFNGSVQITGDVLPNFSVEAEGSVAVGGSAFACRLNAKKNIIVTGGIIGKNKGTASAGASMSANYVENASLDALENIIIKNGITGCQLTCDGFIAVENPNARAVSSCLKAAKGISIRNVGSRADHNSKLITGLNPVYEKKILAIMQAMENQITEVKRLEKRYGEEALQQGRLPELPSKEMRIDMEKWKLFKEEIEATKQTLAEREAMIYQYDSKMIIKGTLYPGVYLKIGKYEKTTDREYTNVIITYSPQSNQLEITPAR